MLDRAAAPVVVLDPGDTAHTIARSLGRLGIRLYGVHGNPHAAGVRSRYWSGNYTWDVAKAAAEDSLTWLQNLAGKFSRPGDDGRPLLIPTDDSSMLFVADHADELRKTFLFPDQPTCLARSLSSKQGMYELCKRHGVPTPETVFPQNRGDVLDFLESARFPVMVKAIFTYALRDRAGVTMVLAKDAGSLLEAYDRLETPENPNLMLQEYIPGGAESVWMLDGYYNQASECLFAIPGQKLRQYPPYTGRTSLGVCVRNDEFTRQVNAFMRALGYRGILDIGYKLDSRDGRYKLLDVNPRIGMTFRLFVDSAGLDVARVMYLDLTGQLVQAGEIREGRKWLAEDVDLISTARYVWDGALGPVSWLRSFRGVEESCWFARDDTSPFWARLWTVGPGQITRIVTKR